MKNLRIRNKISSEMSFSRCHRPSSSNQGFSFYETLLCIFIHSFLLLGLLYLFSTMNLLVKKNLFAQNDVFLVLKTDNEMRNKISKNRISYWKNPSGQEIEFLQIKNDFLETFLEFSNLYGENLYIEKIDAVYEKNNIVGMKVTYRINEKTFVLKERFCTRFWSDDKVLN